MGYFDELLITRPDPYAIDVELEIRKKLENATDYTFEFQKNDDKYDYDISVYKYYINGADWDKKIIAYIELEVSESWKDDYPSYWKTYSFLKRKVYKYENGEFLPEIKNNGDKTIYVIFNKSLTDAVCCDITTIAGFNESNCSVSGNARQDAFLREPLTSNKVTRGLQSCINRIINFIKSKES